MSRLSDKAAIVTGASKGIGAGIATALGAEGARVAVNYSSAAKAPNAGGGQFSRPDRTGRARSHDDEVISLFFI